MFVYCDFNKLTCFNVGQVMENTTLFTYSPGENISTYANTSFVPIFLDEPINFATDELRVQQSLLVKGTRTACSTSLPLEMYLLERAPNKWLYKLKVNHKHWVRQWRS